LKLVAAVVLLLIGQVLIVDRTALPAAQKDSVTWDAVFAWIQRDWPEVPQMSTRGAPVQRALGRFAEPGRFTVSRDPEREVIIYFQNCKKLRIESQIICFRL
jgi:hypothetical protein